MKKSSYIMLGAILCSLGLSGCEFLEPTTPIPDENGQLKIQASSTMLLETNYESTIEKLKKYGFTNFKINFMNDVIFGIFVTENNISSININGKTDFNKTDLFDVKSVITMDVHSKHGGSKIIAKPYNGQIPIMYENKELIGQDKLVVAQSLSSIGFINITYTPVMDCKNSNDSLMNTINNLSINSETIYYYYDCFDINTPIKIYYHTTEGDYCTNGLEHTLIDSGAIEPTCTESGWTSETYCSVCNKVVNERIEIPMRGHKVVVDKEGRQATCTTTGLSDETHCEVCGEKLSEQTVLPVNTSNHVNIETINGYLATCVSTGLTDKIVCKDCGVIVSEHQTLPINPNNHTNIVEDEEVRPSNGNDGRSGGSHCEDCKATIKTGKTIPWSGSAEEKQALNELESYFPKSLAKKAVLTAMCNYFSIDVLDSTGNYYVASKLHNYAYASSKFKITASGNWKWAGDKEWRFEGFTIYGGDYSQTYPLYGYISMDSTKFHLSDVNNGKSNNPSQYITHSESTCFNFSRSLVE